MILAILREHFRAQKFALLSLSAVIAVAAGFGAYAVTEASWKSAAARFDEVTTTSSAAHGAQVVLTDIGASGVVSPQDWGTPMTSDEVADLVGEASAEGTGAWADASVTLMLSGPGDTSADLTEILSLLTDGAPWDHVWPAGTPVAPGSIALPSDTARFLGLEVGDPVTLWTAEVTPRQVATLTYAGAAYDSLPYAPWAGQHTAYANFADLASLAELWDSSYAVEWAPASAQVQWNSDPEQILESRFVGEGGMWMSLGRERPWFSGGSASPWIFAAALGLGAIIMAAAAGRAQTQRRVQWIATARVLGARRAHFVGIGAAESGIHIGAGAVGAVAGWALADASRRAVVAATAVPPPVDVAVPVVGWLLVAAGVVALAAVSAAIPALLATRIEPVAALKDTPAMDEVELSRRVPFAPVAIAAGIAWLATVVLFHSESQAFALAGVFVGAVALVLLVATFVEGCRRGVSAIAARLQRSNRPVLMQAGLTIGAHPRQSAAGALIAGLTSAGIAAWLVVPSPQDYSIVRLLWTSMDSPYYWNSVMHGFARSSTIGVIVASQALIIMVMATTRRISQGQTALTQALGLDRSRLVAAQALAWVAGPFLGWLAGTALASAVAATVVMSQLTLPAYGQNLDSPWLGLTQGILTAIAVAAALAAMTALIAFALAALLERRPAPLATRSAA